MMGFLLACVLSVHDGDTVRCNAERIRIAAIDAPELPGSPRCEPKRRRQLAHSKNPSWCNYKLAIESRDALRAFVMSGRVRVYPTGERSYGRQVARVTVNGRDVGAYLVSRGLARWWR